jgi:rhodanese-related sulfurtransferase
MRKTTTTLLALLLLAPAAPLAAASPGPPAAPADPKATVPPGVVDGATARRLVEAGAVLLDVRTPQEFAAGHPSEARNIPHDQIRSRAAELGSPATPIVLYCQSGRRSGIAAGELRRLGYQKLWDLQRHDAWPAAGGPAAPGGATAQ